MSLIKLFFIYVKIGAILLGGGYVIFPIMEHEFVQKRELVSQEQLVEYFALSQSLPGIIAANMSMLIGYKLCGKFGAITAMLGVIFVPFWTIVLLASVLSKLLDNNYIQGALWGVSIAVIALILLTVRELWQKSERDLFYYFIFLSSLICLLIFNLSPIQTILIFVLIGVGIKILVREKI